MSTRLKTNPDTYKKTVCRYCDWPLPKSFLDMGEMPLANSLVLERELDLEPFACPLSLTLCPSCGLVQLTHAVAPELMFSNYLYVSSTTKTFQKHFSDYAKTVKTRSLRKDNLLAVDIGSNDGLLLSCYQAEGMRAVGIEPAKNLSDEANKIGRPTINCFFDSACVDQILKEYGPAHVVSANNVFAHIDNIQEVLRNVDRLLDRQGMFVIEFPYLVTMLEEMLFDMIYHEHLSYISLTALTYVLARFHFELYDVEQVSSHGGSLRVFIQKKGAGFPLGPKVKALMQSEEEKGCRELARYRQFAEKVFSIRRELVQLVEEIKVKGKSISGYGAPAKASTLIHFCRFDCSQLDYIVDDNPLKQNRFIPGARIPIVPRTRLEERPTDFVLIFAWNFAPEIMEKLKPLRSQGIRFLVPMPTPKII